jgi:hypothetical protein
MSTNNPSRRDDDATRENPVHTTRSDAAATTPRAERHEVVGRQKDQFGGMKFGSAFFGWLTATGTAVILTALLAAIAAAVGYNMNQPAPAAPGATPAQTIGIAGAVVTLVVVLVAFYCGGYVAGRMARFNGLKQGLGVWLWAIIIAIVLGVLGLVAGSRLNLAPTLNSLPRIPLSSSDLTTGGILTAVAIAVVSLIGALLGGLGGMRFHRRVDRAGFDTTD